MPTDNPKISAYVPQIVFDKVEEFRRKRNLSMSQAAIIIFAEYFGIEQAVKEFTEGTVVGGVTLNRIEEIESSVEQLTLLLHESNSLHSEPSSNLLSELEKVTDKMSKIEERLDQLEYWKNESTPVVKIHETQLESLSKYLSQLSKDKLNSLPSDIDKSQQGEEFLLEQKSDLLSKLPEDILSEPFNILETSIDESQLAVNNTIEQSTLVSGLPNEPSEDFKINEEEVFDEILEDINEESQLQLISKSLSEPLKTVTPIDGVILSKRLLCHKDTIPKTKKSKSIEEFTEWTKKRDPDNIGWIPNPNGRGFVSESETSSELLSRLQVWIDENSGKPQK